MKKNLWIAAFVLVLVVALAEGVMLWNINREGRRHSDRSQASLYAPRPLAVRASRVQPVSQDPWSVGLEDDWDPFREMESMQRLMDRLFQDTYHRGLVSTGRHRGSLSYAPEVDFQAKDDAYVATFDLPGLDKDKIDIKVQNRHLTVSGQREEEKTQTRDDGSYQRMERSFGSFVRSLPLPADAAEEGITADSKNGVLTVRIPRQSVPAQSEKKISVQ